MGLFDKLTERVGGLFEEFIEEVSIPDELHQRLRHAMTLYDQGQWERALQVVEGVEHLRADLARVQLIKGMCLYQLGQAQPAAVALKRAIELKEDATGHFWAGLAMERMTQWRQAQHHFSRARTLGPQVRPVEVAFGLGRTWLEQGRLDKALKELRIALQDASEAQAIAIRTTLAKALWRRGTPHEAKAALPPLAPDQLQDVADAMLYGSVHEATGDEERARRFWARALSLGGNDAQQREASLGAARGALNLGDVARAQDLLSALLAKGQDHAEVYILQGKVHEQAGRWEAACAAYNKAILLHPAHGQAWLGLGRACEELGDPEGALGAFERAMEAEQARDPALALLGQGQARLEMGDLSGAKQVLDEAGRVVRGESGAQARAQIHLALAKVARKSGDFVEALMVLRAAEEEVVQPQVALDIAAERDCALEQLRPSWGTLPQELSQPLEVDRTLSALQDYIASDARLIDFLPAVGAMIRAMQSPLSVAIVGEFNAGKSTLINALLGEEVLPTGILPTTAHTGMIQYGPRRTARVIGTDGQVEELDFKAAKSRMKQDAQGIHHLEYTYPHPQLRVVHFWDTPGFNALEERHDEVAARALEEAEAILWVLDANQVLSQTEFERLEAIAAGKERVLVVINKIDRLTGGQEELDDLVTYVQDHAAHAMLGCYPICALAALRAVKEDPAAQMPREFEVFRRHLEEEIFDRANQIKVIEAKRQLVRLVLTLSAFQHGLIQRYQGLRQQAEQVGQWVEGERPKRAGARSAHEAMEYEDQLGFLLRTMVKEIEESLRPRSSLGLGQKMQFGHQEDRAYLLDLLRQRFEAMLLGSRERVLGDVVALEAEVASQFGTLIASLSMQDGRGVRRRLEGFQDELRVLRLLLEERVYGQLRARALGQIEAAGQATLDAVEATADEAIWRAELRGLLPDGARAYREGLGAWYVMLFEAARRLCRRIERDLVALELEAAHRYDLGALETLVGMDEALSQGEEAVDGV